MFSNFFKLLGIQNDQQQQQTQPAAPSPAPAAAPPPKAGLAAQLNENEEEVAPVLPQKELLTFKAAPVKEEDLFVDTNTSPPPTSRQPQKESDLFKDEDESWLFVDSAKKQRPVSIYRRPEYAEEGIKFDKVFYIIFFSFLHNFHPFLFFFITSTS